MPYVIVSTQVRVTSGPVVVGDEHSDKELMDFLGAKLENKFGNTFSEYICDVPARVVLDKLESKGFSVVGQSATGQTCIWTLKK